jgi:outer membrane lipoprotein LolB
MPASAVAEASAALPAAQANEAQPKRALPRLDLQGQLSIKLGAFGEQPAKGLSLGFFFNGNTDTGQLDLMTLMGSQMAQVNWTPDEAWLSDDKGRHPYASLDALSRAALGEALPLRTLIYWMQGQADPMADVAPGPEPDTFVQSGWTIDTRQLRVKKLQAERPASATQRSAQIKVYLDR